jgi:hypothetical protein
MAESMRGEWRPKIKFQFSLVQFGSVHSNMVLLFGLVWWAFLLTLVGWLVG